MKNVIFFSRFRKDVNSPKLMALLKSTPFAKDFYNFCVDANPVTKKRNDDLLFILEVTEVPTMFVNGQKYVGEEAFQWLYTQMQQLNQQPMMQQDDEDYHRYQRSLQGGNVGQGLRQQHPYMTSQQGPPPQMMPQMQPQQGRMRDTGPLQGDAGGLDSVGLSGLGGGDSTYANPFAPSDMPGVNQLTPEQMLTTMQTKGDDGNNRMDDALKRFSMERDAQMGNVDNMMRR
jgi:hypothetical protein